MQGGRVLTIVIGSRPQFLKLVPMADALRKAGIPFEVLDTGQHYDHALFDVHRKVLDPEIRIHHLGAKPNEPPFQVAEMIRLVTEELNRRHSTHVVVFGDTNSTLAGGLSARLSGRKLAHLEAGPRTGDRTFIEEVNRIVIDSISDYCFCPHKEAYDHLVRENNQSKFSLTGDVVYDLYFQNRETFRTTPVSTPAGEEVCPELLVTLHRGRNVDDPRTLKEILEGIFDASLDTLFPVHPRTRKTLKAIGIDYQPWHYHRNIRFVDPLDYLAFGALLSRTAMVLTDSGGVHREAAYHGKACLFIGNSSDCRWLIDHGWVQLVAPRRQQIASAITEYTSHHEGDLPAYFGNGCAAKTITRIIANEFLAEG